MGKWKKILLAIDKAAPENRAFLYAVELCRHLGAELSILQVLGKRGSGPLGTVFPRTNPDRVPLAPPSTLGVTPGSDGGYYLKDWEYGGQRCSLQVKWGVPQLEIAKYLEAHREVVIAIDDTRTLGPEPEESGSGRDGAGPGRGHPGVPMVIVRKKRVFRKLKYLFKEAFTMVRLFGRKKLSPGGDPVAGNAKPAVSGAAVTEESLPGGERMSRLVVKGRESAFSSEVVEYSLELAQRMNYEIIALNTVPLSGPTLRMFSSPRDRICEDFRTLSEKNAHPFKQEAMKRGIPFIHKIKYVNTDAALDEIHREFDEIGFVVSEAESDPSAKERITGEGPPTPGFFVFSMH
jgi:hypothetical protein